MRPPVTSGIAGDIASRLAVVEQLFPAKMAQNLPIAGISPPADVNILMDPHT